MAARAADSNLSHERGHFLSQSPLTGPVLKAEAVTGNLPHCVGRSGLCCQQEVLVEVALLIAVKFYCPACHHEDCRLPLRSLLFPRRESIKKTTQRLPGREVGNVHGSYISCQLTTGYTFMGRTVLLHHFCTDTGVFVGQHCFLMAFPFSSHVVHFRAL